MNRLTLIATSFLLFMTFTIQAQEAHRKYNTTVSQIEKQPDSRSKSEERGKALAIFYDSRIIEAGSETAKTETATIFRQLIDYDFLAAYNFLMKLKKQDDALLFTKSYMSQQERTMIRTVASHTVSNVNTTTSSSYPANIPQPGYGVKGKWNSGTLTANTTNANNNAVVQTQTNNGVTEVKRVYNAEQTKNLPVLELKPFKNHDGKWGFKDDKNIIIVQSKYDEASPFSEGMAAVCITENNTKKWGYIDQNGKEVVPLIYGDAIRFSEGLAAVRPVGKTWNSFYGFIDKSGKLVIPHEYPFVFDTAMYDGWVFVDGKAKVYKDKRIFYIDKTGKELKDGAIVAQELKAFSDKPFNRFGKWGFKDQSGKVIVAPKYNSSHQFREGLAAVSIGGSYDEEFDMVLGSKYGFIDNTGKEVIALKYESINDGFYEGLAAVKLNGKWGYINTAGNEVIPFQYSEAFIFMNGKAKVRKDGKEFFIDKTGKEVK
ncbi:WG repeat-containing protein [Flavobacterium capsici]|uniref:WG repeat-containing protein n=1 Tax=Flavobacterium capsici TaxID=3075618 RepID=A0AA96EX66_9FLAO|nr:MULTISPECIES: WG repeat-containing protein [unclassified Flavobacterium]WNM18475.1 WG repeat-containing protein [Flavobacterium sp. PMR2A8]WNM22526.1 WG repeat-containing protein [Flavobacterium sp. PMTSA4]